MNLMQAWNRRKAHPIHAAVLLLSAVLCGCINVRALVGPTLDNHGSFGAVALVGLTIPAPVHSSSAANAGDDAFVAMPMAGYGFFSNPGVAFTTYLSYFNRALLRKSYSVDRHPVPLAFLVGVDLSGIGDSTLAGSGTVLGAGGHVAVLPGWFRNGDSLNPSTSIHLGPFFSVEGLFLGGRPPLWLLYLPLCIDIYVFNFAK